MTCHELHALLENPSGSLDSCIDPSIAGHVAGCAVCRTLVDAHSEVAAGLQSIRNSAPEFPATLDSRVLSGFRRHSASADSVRSARMPWKANRLPALALVAALVVSILVVRARMEWFFPSEERAERIQQQRTDAARKEQPERVPAPLRPATTTSHNKALQARNTAKRRTAQREARARTTAPSADDSQVGSLPAGFTGLMYCDPLSCDGTMEVVRVQLPPQQLGITPAYVRSNNLISADVFVGADGIARGVRIVE